MNDSELKDYFHQNRPRTSDESTYLAGLSAKMDAVAEIKRLHDSSIRKYRRICTLTFALGCFAGMAVIAFALLNPIPMTHLSSGLLTAFLSFVYDSKTVIATAVIAACLALGLILRSGESDVSPFK